ncbi:major facilitator superfamily transporter [Rhizoctonia solani]|uniref:Major facilitator superfamily transporter n=1 Tax=Rhizoctonia solani TaxID=456999 RepID=A0A8H8NQ79_9AGAM|nr:major facilitator superfamily transporter [Rhizoctonia solani]QRW17455.1 major facilitator superfamily transporter [Rhizoctonia solani]
MPLLDVMDGLSFSADYWVLTVSSAKPYLSFWLVTIYVDEIVFERYLAWAAPESDFCGGKQESHITFNAAGIFVLKTLRNIPKCGKWDEGYILMGFHLLVPYYSYFIPMPTQDSSSQDPKTLVQSSTQDDAQSQNTPSTLHDIEASVSKEKSDFVDWDSPDDLKNPRNWTFRHRWAATAVVSLFTFMSPLASSMVAPALPQVTRELGLEQGSVLESMTLSVFVLAYAVGPLFFGPLSEIYGRRLILQGSNMFFLGFNIACSRAQTSSQLLAFRFLAGLGGSAPLAIGGGTIADLWAPEERGMAMSLYSLAPLTGPAIGPVAGAWIAERTSWRWVFYSTSIADGVIQLVGLWYLTETYAPTILAAKARTLRKSTGDETICTAHEFKRRNVSTWRFIATALLRSIKFLMFDPVMTVMATYMAVMYGTMYLQLTTFASIWTQRYGESVGIAGLNYLFMGAGFTAGAQLGARALDRIYRHLKAQNDGVPTPEMRLPLLVVGSLMLPAGLLLYGWTAEASLLKGPIPIVVLTSFLVSHLLARTRYWGVHILYW